MANKVALLILGVIVLTSMGVGALVGLQFGPVGPSGADDPGSATPTTDGGTNTATATAGASETPTQATDTATRTATVTPTPTPRPTVAPSEFDRAEIEAAVLAQVNAYRQDQNLDSLSGRSRIVEMARFHSENMAGQGYVSHVADGFDTQDRYERFDLSDRCRVSNNQNAGILQGSELETLKKTVAGRQYEEDGETRFNGNESAVAAAVVQSWIDNDRARSKLNLENANEAGVGVVVTENGRVYVTMDLC